MLDVVTPVPGADHLIAWFGEWPSFHDAEVLNVHLDRTGPSRVQIHTWKRTNDLDGEGYYIVAKHVVVTFQLQGVNELALDGFSAQNVISGLSLQQKDTGYELMLWPCYGIAGSLTANEISIAFEPGRPLFEP
jgi:hypothetical protein